MNKEFTRGDLEEIAGKCMEVAGRGYARIEVLDQIIEDAEEQIQFQTEILQSGDDYIHEQRDLVARAKAEKEKRQPAAEKGESDARGYIREAYNLGSPQQKKLVDGQASVQIRTKDISHWDDVAAADFGEVLVKENPALLKTLFKPDKAGFKKVASMTISIPAHVMEMKPTVRVLFTGGMKGLIKYAKERGYDPEGVPK